jgi:hypothetical protein
MPQPSTSTLPWSAPTTPSTANSVPPAHAPDTTVPLRSRTFESTTTAPPVSSGPATATTSLGGTIWTRCSGPDAIVFIAAIPKSGYESIAGTQTSTAVQERFTNGNHVSTIQAECSDGVVHAEVEEEAE